MLIKYYQNVLLRYGLILYKYYMLIDFKLGTILLIICILIYSIHNLDNSLYGLTFFQIFLFLFLKFLILINTVNIFK